MCYKATVQTTLITRRKSFTCSIMKMSPSDYSDARGLRLGTFLWLILSFCGGVVSFAQTTFLDFNTTGQYTNNFNAWNDNGAGVDAGSYCFTENATAGV